MPADAKAATVDILEALLATPPAAPTSGAEAFPNQAALARLVRRIPGPAPARNTEPPRARRPAMAAPAVGAYIGAAYWFTSSTSFANPAVTVGRIFSDTFAGIAPSSAPGFVVAQLVGLVVGVAITLALYPDAASSADDVVVPHPAPSNSA